MNPFETLVIICPCINNYHSVENLPYMQLYLVNLMNISFGRLTAKLFVAILKRQELHSASNRLL